MSDEVPHDLMALYRAGASEEPGVMLDEAVLEAAHRRTLPHPAAILAVAAVAVMAVVAHNHHPPTDHSAAVVAAQPVPPGLEEGRTRLVMLTQSPATERPGMALQPAIHGDVQ
jgi:hypothetical protein